MYWKKRPSLYSFLHSLSAEQEKNQRFALMKIFKLNNKINKFIGQEPLYHRKSDCRKISKDLENFTTHVQYSQFTYELHLLKLSIFDETTNAINEIKKRRVNDLKSLKFFRKRRNETFTYFFSELNRTAYLFLLALLHNRTEIIDLFFQSNFPNINMSAIPARGPSFYLLAVSMGNQLMNTLFTKHQIPNLLISYNNITPSMIAACNSLYLKIDIVETPILFALYRLIINYKRRMSGDRLKNILPDNLCIFSTDFLALCKNFRDFEDILNFYKEEKHFITYSFLINTNFHFICKLLEYQNILSDNFQKFTPLHSAALSGSVELIYIYNMYFNINSEDVYGRRPIDYAFISRSRKTYVFLRLFGAQFSEEKNENEKFLFPDEQENDLKKRPYLEKLHEIDKKAKKCKLDCFIDIFREIEEEPGDNEKESCKDIWAVKWIYQYRLRNQKIGRTSKSHFHINSIKFGSGINLDLPSLENIEIDNKTDIKEFKRQMMKMCKFQYDDEFTEYSYFLYSKNYLGLD